ncbi:hypothetical protein [Mucilaginibacter sp.]
MAEVSVLILAEVSVLIVELEEESVVAVESEPDAEPEPLQATIEDKAKANTPNLNAFFILIFF